MAQDSWPHAGHNSRNVTDSEYEKMAAQWGDGIYGDTTSSPVVTAGSGLQVLVKAGFTGSLRGHAWQSGASDVPLSVSSNSSGSTRIDRAVLRLDRSNWTVAAAIREGTPGAGAPALVQQTGDTGLYEIRLGEVTVVNGASSVVVDNCPLFAGSNVRAENSPNPNPALGEISYRPTDGEYRGYVGSGNYVTLYSDSGDQSLTGGFSTWDTVGPMTGRKINGVVSVQINVKRTGSTFEKSDDDGSHVATVPSDLRPTKTEYFTAQFTSGESARAEVRTDGQIWILHLSSDVAVGRYLRLSMTWLKPD